MAFSTIDMNLTGLTNVTSPNITTVNSLSEIINVVDTSLSGLLVFFTLTVISIVLYITLSDTTPFQDFGYDYLRALNISLACALLLGVTLLEVGWTQNFYSIGLFTTLWFMSLIGVYIVENQN